MKLKSIYLKAVLIILFLVSLTKIQAQTTRLRNDFCNLEIAAINTNIYANSVTGAIMYRFRIKNLTTGVTTIYDRNQRFFNLVTAGAFPEVNQTFEIDVAVNKGLGFESYGITCLIYTPVTVIPVTQLRSEFCGNQISALGTNIYADGIVGAVMYRYRIINITTGITTIYNRSQRWFNLITAGASPQIAQEYLIDVAVDRGNGFGAYGPACSLFTPHIPATQLIGSECGTTKNMLFYEFINAVPNSQSEAYQFRIREGSFTAVSNPVLVPQIRFHDFIGVNYGKTYLVDVRMLKNGLWGPYGQSCSISTVQVPYTQVQTNIYGGANNCGWQMPSIASNIYAHNISFISSYKFRVTKGAYVDSFTTVSRRFKLTDLPNFNSNMEFNTAYNVEVALNLNGTFTNYGVMCQVFTPPATTQLRSDFCGANLTALGQNIFADAFTGATHYRFEINNGSSTTEFTTTNRFFNLISAGVAALNTTYTVRVAIGVNGNFYSYGSACTVRTPNAIIQNNTIEELPHSELSIIDDESQMTENLTEINEVQNISNSTFNVLAIPNPSSNNFRIEIKEAKQNKEIHFIVANAMGIKIYESQTTIEKLNSEYFGENFASGIYFVSINYEGIDKTLRIIKK
jgi:hypothetical protein